MPASAKVSPEPLISATLPILTPDVLKRASTYLAEFRGANPFPHVVIDNFFEPESAERALADFPPFSPENAKTEFGTVGRKATVADIRTISPFYAQVYDTISSRDFLELVSKLTGIENLIHDEKMYGGGTHENLDGQELDPHVDFNFIEDRKLHRRLNLLLYLNKEWEQSWGGCLELHSNPRSPENQIKVIPLAFNRCVIFETSERSWHGFERIRLPENKRQLSRKLLSIYLYTRERPAAEIAPPHGTFYVQRPLSKKLVPGYTLTAEDVKELQWGTWVRDTWIEIYQKKELADSGRIQELAKLAESLEQSVRVPLAGQAIQQGQANGYWADGWIGKRFEVGIRPARAMRSLTIHGYLPENFGHEVDLFVSASDAASNFRVTAGAFSLEVPVGAEAGTTVRLGILCDKTYSAKRSGAGEDERELGIHLRELQVNHPAEIPEAGSSR